MGSRRLKRFKNKGKKRKINFPFKFLVVLFLLFVSLFYFLTKTKYWDGESKLSLVSGGESGEVQITTYDPTLDQITTMKIPGNTQVDVARNLGTWKLGSVWKLGQGEKVGGVLLQETIVKSFGFPVTTWSAEEGIGLSSGNISNLPSSVFSLYKTNLTMGDKLRMFLFSLKVNSANKVLIDLSDTQILKKTKLVDGDMGYSVTNSIPTEFIGLFSDINISKGLFTVSLTDLSEENGLSDDISTTIEYLGAKVVSKTGGSESELDCEVISKSKKFALVVSQIFGCRLVEENPDGNFDLEIKFGKRFSARF